MNTIFMFVIGLTLLTNTAFGTNIITDSQRASLAVNLGQTVPLSDMLSTKAWEVGEELALSVNAVPEPGPASLVLGLLSLGMLAISRRRLMR